MQKVDSEALRANLTVAYTKMASSAPDAEDRAAIIRAMPMLIELQLYEVEEMMRYQSDPMTGIKRIAIAVANVLSNPCLSVVDEPGHEGTNIMSPSHKAVHVMLDEIDRSLHQLLAEHAGLMESEPDTLHDIVKLPMKEVGDA